MENGVQVSAILDPAGAGELLLQLAEPSAVSAQPEARTIVDAAPERVVDYWARAALGDRAGERLMVATTAQSARRARTTRSVFTSAACKSRSTFSERSSSCRRHQGSARPPAPTTTNARPYLTAAWTDLKPWSLFDPVTKAPMGAAEGIDAPMDQPARRPVALRRGEPDRSDGGVRRLPVARIHGKRRPALAGAHRRRSRIRIRPRGSARCSAPPAHRRRSTSRS